jgi:hypothetical protein
VNKLIHGWWKRRQCVINCRSSTMNGVWRKIVPFIHIVKCGTMKIAKL